MLVLMHLLRWSSQQLLLFPLLHICDKAGTAAISPGYGMVFKKINKMPKVCNHWVTS